MSTFNIIVPNEGKVKWLSWALTDNGGVSLPSYLVHLFQNDITPSETSVFADFIDATFAGYAAVSIMRNGWEVIDIDGDNNAFTSALVSPAFASIDTTIPPQNAYGWYMTPNGEDVVLLCGRFSSPSPMKNLATETIDPLTVYLSQLTG